MIVITAENVEQLKTPAGGINQATAEALAIWPLLAGWKERLIGRAVSDKTWKDAVKAAGRGPIYRRRGNTRRR